MPHEQRCSFGDRQAAVAGARSFGQVGVEVSMVERGMGTVRRLPPLAPVAMRSSGWSPLRSMSATVRPMSSLTRGPQWASTSTTATSRVGQAERTFDGGGAAAAAIRWSTSSRRKAKRRRRSRRGPRAQGRRTGSRRAGPPDEVAAETTQGGQGPLAARRGELVAEQVQGTNEHFNVAEFRHDGIPAGQ